MGNAGHDWIMPQGTALKAVAAAEAVVADDVSGPCPIFSNSIAVGKQVIVQHTASNGDYYDSSYNHISTIAFSVGDIVDAGQNPGTSGNTGCSTAPHLHFSAYRWLASRNEWVIVEPYGWTATAPDPWSRYPDGTTSYQLWKVDQAPTLVLQ